MYIVSNDPDTDTLIVSLSGIGGEQAPVISSSENILNFGQVADGQISTQIVTIYNLGVVDLEIEEISFYGGNESLFSTDFTEASLSQNDSVHIEISYLGQSTIQYPLESFLVFSNDETSSPLSIILVTGFSDDILYSEIVYDDGNINDSFPVGSGNYIAQKFFCSPFGSHGITRH